MNKVKDEKLQVTWFIFVLLDYCRRLLVFMDHHAIAINPIQGLD